MRSLSNIRSSLKGRYISFDNVSNTAFFKLYYETDDKYIFSWNDCRFGWVYKNSSYTIKRCILIGNLDLGGYININGINWVYILPLGDCENIAYQVVCGNMCGTSENRILIDYENIKKI